MIAHVRGTVVEKTPARTVIEACGVGYEFLIPVSTYERLPQQGKEVLLLATHVVRDDCEQLFGFATADERDMFNMLVTVSGVGPRTALSILSGMSLAELASAISGGDAKRIATIKGVGGKTAGKICVELKDKTAAFAGARAAADGAARPAVADAVAALKALGFSEEAAGKMVAAAVADGKGADSAESIIKLALSSRRDR